jgi:prepilin-type N-terminal cleavage/methylation domain-containing protein
MNARTFFSLVRTKTARKGVTSGFTLVELLIVIAIIGILVSLGAVSYTTAQQKGRDGRRKSDLRAVQNAWEQYYSDNTSAYPATCSVGTTYLPGGMPEDPKTGDPYAQSCSATTYCFCATLESGLGNATNTNCTFGSGSYYCVKNLQ